MVMQSSLATQATANPPIPDASLMALAQEIARGIYEVPDILVRFGINERFFDSQIKTNRRFMAFLGEAMITWNSSLNAAERNVVKAETMTEMMIEKAWEYYQDKSEPLAARAALLQTVSRIAGLYEGPRREAAVGEAVGRPGDRVNITINLHPHSRVGGASATIIDHATPVLPPSDPIDDIAPGTMP
jgi:hypothetical protein